MRHQRMLGLLLFIFVLIIAAFFMYGCVQTTDIIIIEDVHVEIDYVPVLPKKL